MKKSAPLEAIALDQGGSTWFAPAPCDLAPFITMFLARRSLTNCERFTIFPNARVELLFNFGSPYLTSDRHGWPLHELAPAAVFSPKTERNEHQCGPLVDWFLVQLSLAGCRALLGAAPAEILQHDRPLSDFVGDESLELRHALATSPDFSTRVAIFTHWARQWSQARKLVTRLSTFCEMARWTAVPTVQQAADLCGVGPRRLRDCFINEVGMTPKKWLALIRAERLWTKLHPQSGLYGDPFVEYSDESHAHREFRRWTGSTIGDYQIIKRMGDGLANGGKRVIVSPV